MLDAFFLHHRDTTNIGDLACSPRDYFDFGVTEAAAFGAKIPDVPLTVLGGGQTWKACVRTVERRASRAHDIVLWGVGIASTAAKSDAFRMMQERCALIGTRCAGLEHLGARYVPCVSAMSEHFDTAPAPSHEVVMFAHAGYSDHIRRLPGVPEISNVDVSLKEAIHHIASGETVVTSSYHGTYWALLLGRRVICVPFSQKFHFFPDPPTMADPDNWPDFIGKANIAEGALDKARALNRAFYEDVINLQG
ncbi:MAG: hypothetical protein CSA70_03005 [Rhodobacterales bacterium]|nr:MAG: hypothetical protein CSA70_03005 [Rhodobacterales bacterium]